MLTRLLDHITGNQRKPVVPSTAHKFKNTSSSRISKYLLFLAQNRRSGESIHGSFRKI